MPSGFCRICYDRSGEFASLCSCTQARGEVHIACLVKQHVADDRWNLTCGACKDDYFGADGIHLAASLWALVQKQEATSVPRKTVAYDFGRLLMREGQLEDAERLYRGMFDIMRRICGEDHDSTREAAKHLATNLCQQSKTEEAVSIFRTLLEREQELHGTDDLQVLATCHGLGVALSKHGELDEAARRLSRTVSLAREVLRVDHPDVLTYAHSLANVMQLQGNLDQADQAFDDVLQKRKLVLGASHPCTLETAAALSMVRRQRFLQRLLSSKPLIAKVLFGILILFGFIWFWQMGILLPSKSEL